MRRLREAADLSDKLERGSFNLRVGCGWLEIKKWSDVSTHTLLTTVLRRRCQVGAAVFTAAVDS
jgi:hypothetical protein